mmetsp:Transcript_16765/g.31375  ORF Transcript_16765/g.31375 Transcript_16765/m.31375 type:complete len:274 (-) Transcript_16765:1545-2366(-)
MSGLIRQNACFSSKRLMVPLSVVSAARKISRSRSTSSRSIVCAIVIKTVFFSIPYLQKRLMSSMLIMPAISVFSIPDRLLKETVLLRATLPLLTSSFSRAGIQVLSTYRSAVLAVHRSEGWRSRQRRTNSLACDEIPLPLHVMPKVYWARMRRSSLSLSFRSSSCRMNGASPARRIQATTPTDQMSVFSVYWPKPPAISGESVYAVRTALRLFSARSNRLERPKSMSRIVASLLPSSYRMCSNLMFRWQIPWLCTIRQDEEERFSSRNLSDMS